jgi:prepilin-type N-terminal cleavage/methylation domain-containing protein
MPTRIGDAAVEPRSSPRRRAGFTFLELLTVMVIAGILLGVSGKVISAAFAGNARQSAVRVVAMTLFQARSIAIQRSRQSWLVRSGNTIKIQGDSAGVQVQLGKTVDLGALYGVTLSTVSVPAGRDDISFDPRGIVTGATTSLKIIVAKGSNADTVCVTGLGNTRARGC